MRFINFLKNFFEESEEELKEEIIEAERIKAVAEKKLKKRKKEPINKKSTKKWSILIIIILVVILGFWGIQKYRLIPKPFKYVCEEKNPCGDCLVTVSCIMFEETPEKNYLYFIMDNKNNVNGDCTAQISINQENSILLNKTYNLNILKAQESKVFKITVDIPEGQSQTSVTPDCEWE